MTRIIAIALALAFVPAASAQLYKYVDKDGKTIYSDQPPPNVESKQLNIPSTATGTSEAAPKSAVEKSKELDKARKDASEKAKKAEPAAKDAEERCEAARNNLKAAEAARRPARVNDAGETVYLEEKEIASLLDERRAAVDKACKKS